jgi:hypothetical protein
MYVITRYYLILKATRTFASKKTQRKRGNFQNKSKGPTFVTEEASSLSEGSAGTSLHVDNKDFGRDDYIPGAPRSAVLEACIFTSVLLFVGGLVLRQVNTSRTYFIEKNTFKPFRSYPSVPWCK